MKSANEKSASGEAQFLAQLADCQGILHKVSRVYGTTTDDRADLFQEILLNAWRAWPSFRGEAKFSTWLYKIALNTALMARRRQKPMLDARRFSDFELPVEPIESDLERLYRAISKLDDAEITANRSGGSNDPKADAAVRFAVKVTEKRGHVSDEDLRAVKLAGYDDAQVIEIVQHVALNTWTNYINSVAGTEIDFPVVTARKAA